MNIQEEDSLQSIENNSNFRIMVEEIEPIQKIMMDFDSTFLFI